MPRARLSVVVLVLALLAPAAAARAAGKYVAVGDSYSSVRNTLPGQLDSVYNAIRSHAATAKVVVVGYPRLFNGQECNVFARISSDEQSRLNATADLLATTTAARASAHGFTFVDPRGPFTGHAVCDTVEWINGLSNPTSESYHPNVAGHQEYTTLVAPTLL